MGESKEVLINEYLEIVKLKSYRNIKRVSGRVLRKELRELVLKELKERKIELNKYIEVDSKVCEKLGEKKVSNYISI